MEQETTPILLIMLHAVLDSTVASKYEMAQRLNQPLSERKSDSERAY